MPDYANDLRKSMSGKKAKPFQSTDPKVDPGFLRDMGYTAKKKKKIKKGA